MSLCHLSPSPLPPAMAWGISRWVKARPGIQKRLGWGLALPSGGGDQGSSCMVGMVSGSDLRSYCPVGFFWGFFSYQHCNQGLPSCFPAAQELRTSAWGGETWDQDHLLPGPCPYGCSCVLGSQTMIHHHSYTASLLTFSLFPSRLGVRSQ